MAKSTAEILFDNISRMYRNIYNLELAFQQAASNPTASIINVTLENEDGTTKVVPVNSFQKIQQELSRIDNNYKSLISSDNLSYTVQADGAITQQTKTSFINAEFLSNFNFDGESCIVDKTSAIRDLVYPLVKIPITLDSKLMSDVYCRTFEIIDGWDNIIDNPTLMDIDYLKQSGKITFTEINRKLELDKYQVQYFGKFTTETTKSITTEGSNVFLITLDKVKYSALTTVGDSITLKVNDLLVSANGASKYQINEIDIFSKQLKITRIAGVETPSIGIDNLYFNETISTTENIVAIPVKPQQKLVVFLSTENLKNLSFPSNGIKLNTAEFKVTYQNTSYSIDEFFSTYVTNFYEYLMSFMDETNIPASLGVIPTKPNLAPTNFKVVQINKHTTDAKTTNEIDELNKQKLSIQNDINYKSAEIKQYQTELDTQKFNTTADKQYRVAKIQSLREEITVLDTNLLTVSRNIDNNATKYGLNTTTPKYKVIGFWERQTNLYSPLTKMQNIIKYEVLYRYLSKNLDTVENTAYKMITSSGEVTVAFSQWNEAQTKTLNKVRDDNGNLVWESQILDSVDEININQLAISINENESIEIKIRAISEAGYPLSPVKSDWSDILRIDFPTELKSNSLSATLQQNNVDLQKSEFNQILINNGLISHISGTFKDGDKTYLHHADDIASGQYTSEQKNISMESIIKTLVSEIESLKTASSIKKLLVQVVDFDSEVYNVSNNTTINLFAGNYTDVVGSILDKTKWGTIIRKKCYIKIKNSYDVPLELNSLIPGSSSLKADYLDVPVLFGDDKYKQDTKQIFYFRDKDIIGQSVTSNLYSPIGTAINQIPNSGEFDPTAGPSECDMIGFDGAELVKGKLSTSWANNFICVSVNHPDVDLNDLSIQANSGLLSAFNRFKWFTNIKTDIKQSNLFDIDFTDVSQANKDKINSLFGFNDKDFYNIGYNSCGSFLYPVLPSSTKYRVIGDTTTASLVIPANSELLIPIMFEYRMIDILGKINGSFTGDTTTDLSYNKKIGIDFLINNEPFKFDINVSAKLKSVVSATSALNISSISGSYLGEGQSTIS